VSTLTVSTQAAFPRVNLLPPEIEANRRFRRVQVGLGAAVTAAVAVVGFLYVDANGSVTEAQQQLDATNTTYAQTQARASEYSEVPRTLARVDAARARVEAAMGQEVRYSYLLNDISKKLPERVWLTTMTVSSGASAAATTDAAVEGANPFAVSGVAQVQFEGDAMSHRDVASWLDYLGDSDRYANPYLNSSALSERSGGLVTQFDTTATVTPEALSHRYTKGSD
jgi:Tfp pilus assembly protein PilN